MPASADVSHIIRWVFGEREPTVELVCPEHPDPQRGIPVEFVGQLSVCAAELSLADYLLLAGAGIRVHVRTDGCARAEDVQCNVRAARWLISQTAAHPGGLVAAPRMGRSVRDVRTLRGPPFSRRQLLGLPANRRAPMPDLGSTERERALFGLRQICKGEIPSAFGSEPAPSAHIIAEHCDGCGVCVRACHDGAMHLIRQDQSFELQHHLQDCTDCGACIELCPRRSLHRQGVATWGDVMAGESSVIAHGTVRTCARCRAGFQPASDEIYCAPCTFRLANPFGTSAPLHR